MCRKNYQGIIFDLDGVICHTDRYHFLAWKQIAGEIDKEVKNIIDSCYEKARKIISDNRGVLDACAELLLEKEKITREEFEALFPADKAEI